ncbi:hypothetical protein ZEAMMB73_Zm00001d018529 [Zea mays]|uniref:Uncharacterized protein n=1 Tax=Zea mays TaxID=4577 RepID=A0A1D6HQ49_MAIZE|nr:hypothetical protein ZEAMMB73_Zm00001d018529 [Zea mays]
MTIADFSDQLFDWQDRLFDNSNGRLEFSGNTWTSLWPGTGKPGLWVTSSSRMAALYTLIVREEEIHITQRARDTHGRDEDMDLVIPPVFNGCTRLLLLEWGSSWDKRMPWEGWVSWGRAMLTKATDKDWPHTSFGILSLGLVK